MSNLRQNSKNSSDFNLGNQKKKKKKKKKKKTGNHTLFETPELKLFRIVRMVQGQLVLEFILYNVRQTIILFTVSLVSCLIWYDIL